jgi:hypothetical protein
MHSMIYLYMQQPVGCRCLCNLFTAKSAIYPPNHQVRKATFDAIKKQEAGENCVRSFVILVLRQLVLAECRTNGGDESAH